MKIKRRDFFKLAAAGSTALIAGVAEAKQEHDLSQYDNAYGVLVDTTVCIGCRKCEYACNDANLPVKKDKAIFEDKAVFEQHRRPTDDAYTIVNSYPNPTNPEKPYYMKIQCMHCNAPACVSACIVGALRKDEKGPVYYEAWKCIGCRYCMVACPFQIPAYEYHNALDPQVRKCTFCHERVTKDNKRPACVEICPNEALTFGTRKELIDLAHSQIMKFPDRYINHVYGETEIGGTSWMYLAGIDLAKTELPVLDNRPIPETTESIQHGVFKNFVPPAALYGLLGLAMFSFRKKKSGEGEGHE
jgi:formate dehydrogenase iron-sulfur subunit